MEVEVEVSFGFEDEDDESSELGFHSAPAQPTGIGPVPIP